MHQQHTQKCWLITPKMTFGFDKHSSVQSFQKTKTCPFPQLKMICHFQVFLSLVTHTSLLLHQPPNNSGCYRHGQKQTQALKEMLFSSCLPEWCHPHSDSAYTKSWQLSASTVAMATALHLPHEPSGATQAAIGRGVGLTGASPNERSAEWCHRKLRRVSKRRASADAPT